MSTKPLVRYSRYIVPVVYLGFCLWGAWFSAHDGLSRLKSTSAVDENNLAYAQEAVRLSPSDPVAYYARSKVFSNAGDVEKGINDLQRAVELSPNDHFLWLELGYLRSQTDDLPGALDNFRRAAALAPFYAQPRWYLGHLLLSINQSDEGFAELRRAATSDPTLYTGLLDLAAQVHGNNGAEIVRVGDPRNTMERIDLARFLIERGDIKESVELLKSSDLTEADRLPLVQALATAKHFYAAYKVWAIDRGEGESGIPPFGQVTNGDFENDISGESVFNWRIGQKQDALSFSLDRREPRSGAKSLRVVFKGNSEPDAPIISQTILVEPSTRYKLVFSMRTKEIVTGGLPILIVTDQSSSDNHELSPGQKIPGGTSEWQEHELNFVTPEGAEAITLSLKRQHCTNSPCPIFGELWLDNISLRPM